MNHTLAAFLNLWFLLVNIIPWRRITNYNCTCSCNLALHRGGSKRGTGDLSPSYRSAPTGPEIFFVCDGHQGCKNYWAYNVVFVPKTVCFNMIIVLLGSLSVGWDGMNVSKIGRDRCEVKAAIYRSYNFFLFFWGGEGDGSADFKEWLITQQRFYLDLRQL